MRVREFHGGGVMTDKLAELRVEALTTESRARDALAAIFESGFQHAREGVPYDYADEVMRRMDQAGFRFVDDPTDPHVLALLDVADAARVIAHTTDRENARQWWEALLAALARLEES